MIFLHPLAGSQHAAPKENHCGGGRCGGQVPGRCLSCTEPVDPCGPPDQSTHGGSSQLSSLTVSQVREVHNFSSWAGWRVAEKPPFCLVHGKGICRVGQGGAVGVPDVVSQGVSEGLQGSSASSLTTVPRRVGKRQINARTRRRTQLSQQLASF